MFSKKTTVKLMFPAFALGAFFAACSNGESISDSKVESVAEAASLPECDSTYEGEMVLVKSDSSIHVCVNKEWTKITQNSDGSYDYDGDKDCSLKQVDINQLQIKCGTDSMTFFVQGNVPISSSSAESASSFELKGALISGNAIKGPFEVNAVATLKEMQIQGDSLSYTGRSFTGSVSGLKGSFVIPNVDLDYPYAEVSVTGKWLNEVTGELSSEMMTLYALVDFTDGNTETNVNVLTHLEYERVKFLVKLGYSVQAAKKQADNEIVSAFGFSTDMGYFEKLTAFNSGDKEAANATLLAISLLFIRDNGTDAEIQASIKKFAEDIATDGRWNDADGEKKKMVAWAKDYNFDDAIENISAWGIQDVPDFKAKAGFFWNNFYGLRSCNQSGEGVVVPAKRNGDDNLHFICKDESWRVATTVEWEPYGWEKPKDGEFRFRKAESGNVYVYDDSASWRASENDNEAEMVEFKEINGNVFRGSITKACYVLEKVADESNVYAYSNPISGSKYSYVQKTDEYADTYMAGYELVKGLCTGTYYSGYEDASGTFVYRPATKNEIYLERSCNNVNTLDLAAVHRVSLTTDSVFFCKSYGSNKFDWEFLRVDEHPYELLTDNRDENTYRTIKIGDQTWMAEDLRYCPPNKQFCGSNFKGDEAISENNICPEGWHVPSKSEFITLIKYVGKLDSYDPEGENKLGYEFWSPGELVEGKYLANTFGFSANFSDAFWTSDKDTENSANVYWMRVSGNTVGSANIYSASATRYASVRCIKNVE